MPNGRLLQGKVLQIQINNKTIIEFGSRGMRNYKGLGLCYLPQPSASADNTNLCLNSPHILLDFIQ